ncbi:MAG: UDP-N-acetylglucosamine 2-epimerase (hydrolyzing), partial [Neisseriaceae bacterium]|nr:UDP-N-acetylglucosamine 2-epimerase (hydrolyzing) [Neisseriaceae bacterium]
MKKILCITGTRADFGKLKSILNYLEKNENTELHLVITGMHVMRQYGETYKEVLRENYKNYYLFSNQFIDEPMNSVLGNTVNFLSRLAHEIKPDMLVIHGDRLEALSGAIVGALGNIRVTHIEGGELSGTIDDSIRHAISKLSHFHLVSNQEAADRLEQLGEEKNNIYIIGSPDLDFMLSDNLPQLDEVKQHYNIDFDQFAISLFHPVTTEYAQFKDYVKEYFSALEQSGKNIIAIYPNNDVGSEYIIHQLDKISTHRIKKFPSIRFEYFLTLLKNCQFIIGNSSAGVREAPLYGVPTIDVGTRQNNRYNDSLQSIFHTDYVCENILSMINYVDNLDVKFKPNFMFQSDSQLSSIERFINFINNETIWERPLQ